ncbi:MAG: dTDP-4-dehydrorhamnose 3,5-epimerase [Ignavibacteriaceae bacterium]|nr:dTDP-4-dehydrorhamnose 3,5-epimerase [Ignavibacteriaceae bacterium]
MKQQSKIIYGTSNIYKDGRGFFAKLFDKSLISNYEFIIKQINFVESEKANTLRGLHYQVEPFSEAKIFRVIDGKIQLAAVSIEKNDIEFLKPHIYILSDKNEFVFVPKHFATGYCTLEDNSKVLYLSDNDYEPVYEKGLLWNDPVLSINWNSDNVIISDKDRAWHKL